MKSTESETQVATTVPSSERFGDTLTFDAEFKGPVKQRGCTDIICLFVFTAFLAGWCVIAAFAFMQGNPEVLVFPTDSLGNICGMGPMKNRTFLFFFDLTKCAKPSVVFTGCPTPQVCVHQCPNETFGVYNAGDPHIKKKLICKDGVNRNSKSAADLVSSNDCAGLYFKSIPLVRRCIPEALLHGITSKGDDVVKDYKNETLKTPDGDLQMSTIQKATKFLAKFLSAKEMGTKMFSDVQTAWYLILIGLIFSMLLSLFWILLMRWIAGIMVWSSIVLVICFSAYACYHSSTMYMRLNEKSSSEVGEGFSNNLGSFLAMKHTWLAFAIISGLLLAILLIVLIFLRTRLFIAIALIKQASKAVGYIMSSLIFPLVPYLIQLSTFAFWASVAVYLASSGKAQFRVTNAPPGSQYLNGTVCDPTGWSNSSGQCMFQAYGTGNNFLEAQLYNLFGLFWVLFFVTGITQVALSGAFATYYWALEKPKDIPDFAMSIGLWRTIRYHMGSVAFGSLLLAFVRTIRVCLEYIDAKLKQYDNRVTKAILCCLKCCFWCLEKFLKFLSKNAYIMIAIYGTNFCVSAKDAFKLLMRNIVRVVVLDKVTDLLLLFGKLVVVGATAALAFYFFSGESKYFGKFVPDLNYNLLPVVIIVVGSYMIASTFFSVYGMAVDTLFLCFLEDCERNEGTLEKPYYMSKELMKILDKKNFRDRPSNTYHS